MTVVLILTDLEADDLETLLYNLDAPIEISLEPVCKVLEISSINLENIQRKLHEKLLRTGLRKGVDANL